jgi:hypothetical protein
MTVALQECDRVPEFNRAQGEERNGDASALISDCSPTDTSRQERAIGKFAGSLTAIGTTCLFCRKPHRAVAISDDAFLALEPKTIPNAAESSRFHALPNSETFVAAELRQLVTHWGI